MHSAENWDNLRFVLAVAESGSVSAAARQLGVNHATVLRRIAAFEAYHSTTVFDRTTHGYSVSDDGTRLIDAAREVEDAIQTVGRIAQGNKSPPKGVVRVTSTDTFCHLILPQVVEKLRLIAPEIRLDILSSNSHLDMSRMDADITIRPSADLPNELEGEVAAQLGFGAYRAPEHTDEKWLVPSGPLAKSVVGDWIQSNVPEDKIVGHADSFITLREMAARCLGQTVLPCFVADPERRLVRIPLRVPLQLIDVWVASHIDLVRVPRLRLVRSFLAEELAKLARKFSGEIAK